jgi:hypothetical protein
MVIRHVVEQMIDFSPANFKKFPVTNLGVDVLGKASLDLLLGSQTISVHMSSDPVLGDVAEAVGDRLRSKFSGVVMIVAHLGAGIL